MYLLAQSSGSNAALFTFLVYTVVVFGLAVLSSRFQQQGGFLSEYFLGSRNLGMWAFALTFAATSASGGSFTGFPSLIYSHGWVLSLWIASYMLVPVLLMGLMGKRLNQIARRAEAITIPEVLSSRLGSRGIGTLATLLIIFFLTFNLVAQFKAGAMMLSTLLDDVPLFIAITKATAGWTRNGLLSGVESGYLLCLLFFAIAVIVYTSYGGFRAVVWTDVLQGIIMVIGVLILLPLVLWQVGGISKATLDLEQMTVPLQKHVRIERSGDLAESRVLPFGTWLESSTSPRQVFRTAQTAEFAAGEAIAKTRGNEEGADVVAALAITSPHEIARIEVPASNAKVVEVRHTDHFARGRDEPGVYVRPPGPSAKDASGFLPLSLAVSFFFFWPFAGAGQPSNMVRLMSFNNTTTLRRAMVTVAIYYSLIYFPLVVIFCCARVLLPGMEIESDRVMPALAEHVTRTAQVPWLAGLLVAAPFAAVMSTVDSFLLMISSAIVRDVYQRDINPRASESSIRRLTYCTTVVVGVAALLGALNPPRFLQDIIVFTGGGLSACFLFPMALTLYWPRFNAPGAIAGMLSGFFTHVAFYGIGWWTTGSFQPYQLGGFDPFIPELLVSSCLCLLVACWTSPPDLPLVRKYFCR